MTADGYRIWMVLSSGLRAKVQWDDGDLVEMEVVAVYKEVIVFAEVGWDPKSATTRKMLTTSHEQAQKMLAANR